MAWLILSYIMAFMEHKKKRLAKNFLLCIMLIDTYLLQKNRSVKNEKS